MSSGTELLALLNINNQISQQQIYPTCILSTEPSSQISVTHTHKITMCVQPPRESCTVYCQQDSWTVLTCTFFTSNMHLCLQGNMLLQPFFLENKPRNSCHFRCCTNYLAFQNSFLCYYLLHKTLMLFMLLYSYVFMLLSSA